MESIMREPQTIIDRLKPSTQTGLLIYQALSIRPLKKTSRLIAIWSLKWSSPISNASNPNQARSSIDPYDRFDMEGTVHLFKQQHEFLRFKCRNLQKNT